MSGDFLDNLTQRLGAPDVSGLQPRVASRFEEAPRSAHDSVTEEAPVHEVTRHGHREFRGPIHLHTMAPDALVDVVKSPANSPRQPHSFDTEAVAHPVLHRPESNLVPDQGRSFKDHYFMQRLEAVTRELNRLGGQIRSKPAVATVDDEFASETNESQSNDEPNIPLQRMVEWTVIQQISDSRAEGGQSAGLPESAIGSPTGPPPTILVKDADAPQRVRDETGRRLSPQHDAEARVAEPVIYGTVVPRVTVARVDRPPDQPDIEGRELPLPQIVVESQEQQTSNERTVNVTIDRIEVRAVPTKAVLTPQRRHPSGPPMVSLDEYLERRVGGKR